MEGTCTPWLALKGHQRQTKSIYVFVGKPFWYNSTIVVLFLFFLLRGVASKKLTIFFLGHPNPKDDVGISSRLKLPGSEDFVFRSGEASGGLAVGTGGGGGGVNANRRQLCGRCCPWRPKKSRKMIPFHSLAWYLTEDPCNKVIFHPPQMP